MKIRVSINITKLSDTADKAAYFTQSLFSKAQRFAESLVKQTVEKIRV